MKLFIGNKNYSSWSLRPWLLLTELGIPFEEVVVPFQATSGASMTTFRVFSPSGKVPCLVDGEITIWDSLAITEYVAEQASAVWPTDAAARAWARCASAEMHSGFQALRNERGMNVGVQVATEGGSAALARDVARIDELWNEGLRRFGGPFLAGPAFTAVDAFFAPVVFRCHTYGIGLTGAAVDYLARMLALPSMQSWERAALAEPWRDEAHELELAAAGRIIEDRRRPA